MKDIEKAEGLSSGRLGMKKRFSQPETVRDRRNVAPPTAGYHYGTGGRRWAGRGRKAPLRSWKRWRKVRKQWSRE